MQLRRHQDSEPDLRLHQRPGPDDGVPDRDRGQGRGAAWRRLLHHRGERPVNGRRDDEPTVRDTGDAHRLEPPEWFTNPLGVKPERSLRERDEEPADTDSENGTDD